MAYSKSDSTIPVRACWNRASIFAALLAVGSFMLAPPAGAQQCSKNPGVCNQPYALCIAAPCLYDGTSDKAVCICEVEDGWSWGPDKGPSTCADRAPSDQGRFTQLTSTFSAALYGTMPFQQFSGYNADCMDAPCVSSDGELAFCLCPVKSQKVTDFWTQAGKCTQPGQDIAYSGTGASPQPGGGLDELAQKIAECSGGTAPSPTFCQ